VSVRNQKANGAIVILMKASHSRLFARIAFRASGVTVHLELRLESLLVLVQVAMEASEGRVSVLVAKRNGAFFRLKCTTNAPPCRAATGGTRHGQGYQQASRSA
jgi:hypothetical protein